MSHQKKVDIIEMDWCQKKEMIPILADFFIDNVDTSYISHGELQEGRAIDAYTWNPNLRELLIEEFTANIASNSFIHKPGGVAFARIDQEIIGLVFVQISELENNTFATLSDFIVGRNRRRIGIGKEMLYWIVEQLKIIGIRRIFLESGKHNESAHNFFESNGFKQCSIVMLMD